MHLPRFLCWFVVWFVNRKTGRVMEAFMKFIERGGPPDKKQQIRFWE